MKFLKKLNLKDRYKTVTGLYRQPHSSEITEKLVFDTLLNDSSVKNVNQIDCQTIADYCTLFSWRAANESAIKAFPTTNNTEEYSSYSKIAQNIDEVDLSLFDGDNLTEKTIEYLKLIGNGDLSNVAPYIDKSSDNDDDGDDGNSGNGNGGNNGDDESSKSKSSKKSKRSKVAKKSLDEIKEDVEKREQERQKADEARQQELDKLKKELDDKAKKDFSNDSLFDGDTDSNDGITKGGDEDGTNHADNDSDNVTRGNGNPYDKPNDFRVINNAQGSAEYSKVYKKYKAYREHSKPVLEFNQNTLSDLSSKITKNDVEAFIKHNKLTEIENADFMIKALGLITKLPAINYNKTRTKYDIVRMRSLDDVMNLRDSSNYDDVDFVDKVASRSYKVRKKQKEPKQALFLLIDDSGSMSYNIKRWLVKTIIVNRAIEAEKNNIVLYIAKFESQVYDVTPVYNLQEANAYYKTISFNGGGTYIQDCVNELYTKYIEPEGLKCEVVVINDGQDPVSEDWHPEFVVHAFMLGQQNNNLKNAVTRSNGMYMCFNNIRSTQDALDENNIIDNVEEWRNRNKR